MQRELDNNAQGILGYVVRWIDQGVGCSKVPDINDVGLMEDRATLRISSQHIANWLRHGVCSEDAGDGDAASAWRRWSTGRTRAIRSTGRWRRTSTTASPSRRRATWSSRAREQPNGYTEPILHRRRREVKQRAHERAFLRPPSGGAAGPDRVAGERAAEIPDGAERMALAHHVLEAGLDPVDGRPRSPPAAAAA